MSEHHSARTCLKCGTVTIMNLDASYNIYEFERAEWTGDEAVFMCDTCAKATSQRIKSMPHGTLSVS